MTSAQTSPARATDASAKPRPKLLAALRKPAVDSSESEAESDNEVSASEDDATPTISAKPVTTARPRPDIEQTNEEEESDGEDAYELMKKRLAANKNSSSLKSAAPQEAQQETPILATIESSEDEDAMPVRANIRKPATTRTKTASLQASASPTVRSRRSSPGLFVTPDPSPAKKPSRRSPNAGSESDESSHPLHNADLQERVRRIREERLAKQQEEEAQQTKPKKIARRPADQGSGTESDGEGGRRLTQHAKPTRRAGKKAMEAMARDQQRISRNMQLTHQAKTKKRFTTQDLFKKFNYQAPGAEVVTLPTPEPSSALASSDAEANQIHDTPPTSPPRQNAPDEKDIPLDQQTSITAADDKAQSPESVKLDKGKGRAPEFQHLPVHPWMKQTEPVTVGKAVVDIHKAADNDMVELSDSDDDLQVEKPKSRFPVFDRLPTKKDHEAGSLVHLRALAQLVKSPPKSKKGQKIVTRLEMEFSLAQKARQQTAKAKEERIADLIRRGHNPETEEEREKRQEEIDDMVAMLEKQRQEDLELAKMERKEAKKNGETIDDLPSSDEDDGDYVGSDEEDANPGENDDQEDAELVLSGSEDEQIEDDGEDEASNPDDADPLIDGMADEDDEPAEKVQAQQDDTDADMDDDDAVAPVRRQMVNRARNRVIDEDDEDGDAGVPRPATPTQPATQNDAMAAFGFGNANAGIGLTQMFAGTMAELESDSQPATAVNTEQDSLDFLRNLPDTQPGANFSQASEFLVPNSQSLVSPQKNAQAGDESQFSMGIGQVVNTSPQFSRTQVEDFEPTQDAGFSFSRSPAGLVLPPSTVDTVMMPVAESPIKQKGKLQRGRRGAAVELSDVEDDLVDAEEESEDDIQRPPKHSKNAFRKMQQEAKKAKAVEEFNKKKSMAREAVMEQAEESEDEYAGLGGASDDEEGEEDEDLKDMIDHNDVKVDERQIAAFYADKTKKDDEKQLAELYKKMQRKGGLRRAGGYDGIDMSDSEDEAELRQRKKRAAFQKQTHALLQDQKVKALADDDKKKAFFNTLADFADEGEYDYLNMPEKELDTNDSQSQENVQSDDIAIPDSQAQSQNLSTPNSPLKRKSQDSQKENRPPPHMRRTAASDSLARKPLTADDVRDSISELIEDPRIVIPDSQLSDAEDDQEAAFVPASRKPIIDRLTLSRQSTVDESVGGDSNVAFHAPTRSAATPGFRVPSLIRQATSNLSVSSERSASNSTPKESAVRRGGTGRSNIHAQAREAERRALLEKKEGKRKEALRKKVEGGRKQGMRSVLSDLSGGFE
ncbi:mrc1-like domain-containing protein [Alternaria burnsii]|uniref:Mrc1-like domain-containing protein n=1 Tax=Alternaria burnsii TaxID=1187904 RepID=A0A8H7B7C4_9PLEO|nr:mrc1-like domain-containing protein [Alternaria burnsii]KAF7675910.1 mrc1-like domain-containing protein [Alternaria burnsii]